MTVASKLFLRALFPVIFLASISSAQTWQESALHMLKESQASAVLEDWRSGSILLSIGAARRSVPGSVLKPLFLNYALEHHIVASGTQVYCRRDLHIAGRAFPCTHPPDSRLLDAQSALAESCNTWFAELGKRFTGAELETALAAANLPHHSLAVANSDERQLTVLGLQGIQASPLDLARAYHDLFSHLSTSSPVWQGMKDSVEYGMANPAHVNGLTILGKTGTANDPGETWSHGWFAGGIPGNLIVVIYVPHGNGGDTARIAAKIFAIANQRHVQ